MYETNEVIHNEFNYAGEIQYDFRLLIMIAFFDVKGQIRALFKS